MQPPAALAMGDVMDDERLRQLLGGHHQAEFLVELTRERLPCGLPGLVLATREVERVIPPRPYAQQPPVAQMQPAHRLQRRGTLQGDQRMAGLLVRPPSPLREAQVRVEASGPAVALEDLQGQRPVQRRRMFQQLPPDAVPLGLRGHEQSADLGPRTAPVALPGPAVQQSEQPDDAARTLGDPVLRLDEVHLAEDPGPLPLALPVDERVRLPHGPGPQIGDRVLVGGPITPNDHFAAHAADRKQHGRGRQTLSAPGPGLCRKGDRRGMSGPPQV